MKFVSLIVKTIFFIGLLIVSPIIFFFCIIVFIEDGLPVFFIQNRLGKNEKIFKLYKIRTMLKEAPNVGTHNITENYFLKIGGFLRKYKIDELPQIYNYINGDINLIGPRPGLPNQKRLLSCRRKNNVFKIKPGITGLGQVLGFDMSNPDLLSDIDNLYIKKKSTKINVLIFFSTFFKSSKKKLATVLEYELNKIRKNNV